MENNLIKTPLKDRIIPWYFVAAFFVVFAVNAVFIYMATQTHTGLVTKHAYEKGLDYDNALDAAKEQNALGWKTAMMMNGDVLIFTLNNEQSEPIKNAHITAHAMRPTKDGYDFTQTLRDVGNGRYEATMNFPMSGQWDITVAATWKQQNYQVKKRVVIK